MNLHRTIATTAAALTLASTGLATAADAPVVTKQQSLAGAAPFTIPGTGVHQGDYMGAKGVLVFKDVTLAGKQEVRLTLRAPKGKTIRGLGTPQGSGVGFAALDRDYVGKRHVTVRAYRATTSAKEVTGRIGAFTK